MYLSLCSPSGYATGPVYLSESVENRFIEGQKNGVRSHYDVQIRSKQKNGGRQKNSIYSLSFTNKTFQKFPEFPVEMKSGKHLVRGPNSERWKRLVLTVSYLQIESTDLFSSTLTKASIKIRKLQKRPFHRKCFKV